MLPAVRWFAHFRLWEGNCLSQIDLLAGCVGGLCGLYLRRICATYRDGVTGNGKLLVRQTMEPSEVISI